ncbi:Pollen preferential protein [Thalictrum thalictroides]|uniref:Pollen preferential protein n=1 Tax=Thalictrum thalictroides TaxID=46969 RepID=A0A7J6X7A2_THATH|nr:Pollen preferential protein [Thalictrum thalictroides]
MTRQIVLRAPSSNRRQPLLTKNQPPPGNSRFAEVVGGTTAECAAVCCCCPCGIVNLLVLAVYKLPAGLCRKALKKKRRKRLMDAGLFPRKKTCTCGCQETEFQIHPVSVDMIEVENAKKLNDKEVMELEKEMWDKFYATGFWRSPSQRDI